MNDPIPQWIYARFIRLYPRHFRDEFGEEMMAVFSEAVTEAAEGGIIPLATVCLRELRDLPLSLVRQHLLDRKGKESLAVPDQTNRPVGWALGFRWVLASMVGVALGLAVTMAIVLAVHTLVGGMAEDRVPGRLFLSIGIGLMQWLVLRRRLRHAGWWVLASIAGWTASDALAWRMFWLIRDTLGVAANYEFLAFLQRLSIGTSLGLLQWLLLRRQFSPSGWWVMANVVGLAVASLPLGKDLPSGLADAIAISVVTPALSGLVLVWLLRHSPSNACDSGPVAA